MFEITFGQGRVNHAVYHMLILIAIRHIFKAPYWILKILIGRVEVDSMALLNPS